MAAADDEPEPKPEELTELTIPDAVKAQAPGNETIGSLLGERYRTLARLGAGAFGEVYRAHDNDLGRDVAVKRIRLEAFVEPSQLEDVKQRFLREAQVAARLRHANIVTTHDIIKTPVTFIVMELVEGRTLQAVLQERDRLPLDETIALMAQVAAALDHAHASQVVHRDVKPANIMIEPGGHVKVMDFGIAKIETGTNLTSTGAIMGTPNYMSPEQAKGMKVDGRSDLFSLGCVLYECLTGHKPFQGESVSVILVKILTEEPTPVDFAATGLPLEVGAVLKRALAKDPAARYVTGAQLIEGLRTAGQTTRVSAPTAGRVAVPARTSLARSPHWRGRPALLLVAGLLVAALLATGTLAGFGGSTRVAGEGGGLVLEETPGLLGRAMGQEPRLRVSVPPGTRLRLAIEAPLSSETARAGDRFSAESTSPVKVEGVVAIPSGVRFSGRVTEAAPAEDSEGRGHMTLALEAVQLPDGSRVSLSTNPLVLRAPATKKKDAGIVGGLAAAGAVVGGLLGGKGGAFGGAVVGGAAGVAVVTTDKGREVALGSRAPLSLEVAEAFGVSRTKGP
ncbi:MAG TPA: serine/threonine-protein kinase [Vicinamibacteria bacterium]|nr:serine/threonine-protein kinase [Vicinamibacteria bacterium]